jgi:hypothetical protein
MRLWRDSSGRLTFDQPGVTAHDYPRLCRMIADAFELAPVGEIVIGMDQMFWDFKNGHLVVSLDWDIWMDFMVVAKSVASEPLVIDIAQWIGNHSNSTG